MADIRAQVTRVREAANDAAATTAERIRDGAGKARDGASDLIATGRDRASEAYGDARDRTQRVATRANEIVQEHPIAAVAGAVAVGAVVAWMFPKSRRAMKALPGLASTAGARILEAAVAARTVAADQAETVKHGAAKVLDRAGDTAGDLVATAKDAAAVARDRAAAAKDSVAASDLSTKASRLADDVASAVVAKVEALADTIKARLPKQ
ncbi:hypothetical protein SAMIE_1014870 [Sphingobium amiense]|uniref:DUF883 domain-containing protein n=1 Tax=Sphingobium amiense TaxID=135719 RepID=A0A494W3S3_9SPHN|nr:DUF883 family protein [Sphingobium amiense]BBD97986.1 hypothetical protein SAMIE_1014870 [Sphingobium amiense]